MLSADINVSMMVGTTFQEKDSTDIVQGTRASASVNNIYYDDGVPVTGTILGAIGEYVVGYGNSFISTVE